jgi:uncharacterized membrane protein YjjP (DUF1212 family)
MRFEQGNEAPLAFDLVILLCAVMLPSGGSSSVAERQLPKLNVAGSIPVSRSIKSTTSEIFEKPEHRLNTIKSVQALPQAD